MMVTKILKLITGEEVIALLDENYHDADVYSIEDVLEVKYLTQGNSNNVGFLRYCPLSDNKAFIIDKRNVIYVRDPLENVETLYKEFIESYKENKSSKKRSMSRDISLDNSEIEELISTLLERTSNTTIH